MEILRILLIIEIVFFVACLFIEMCMIHSANNILKIKYNSRCNMFGKTFNGRMRSIAAILFECICPLLNIFTVFDSIFNYKRKVNALVTTGVMRIIAERKIDEKNILNKEGKK